MSAPSQDHHEASEIAVTRLAESVHYQEGSIVSRTLIKQKQGTVTAFAFDRGEALSEHSAAYDALVYVVEGAAEVTVGGRPFRLHAGDMIVLPAAVPHAVRAIERFKMVLTMIKS